MIPKRVRVVLTASAAVVAIAAITFGALHLATHADPAANAFAAVPRPDAATPAPVEPAPPGTVSVDSTTPAGAAAGFLAAEAARDDATSFSLLDSEGQRTHGTVAGWTAAHGGLLPIAGASLRSVEDSGGGDRATVVVDVSLHPQLDPVAGLVPPGGTLRLALVREQDRWRVALDGGGFTPRWPSDDSAPSAVGTWAKTRQSCGDTTGSEYVGGLLGPADLVAGICGTKGDLTAGTPERLAQGPDAAPLTAVFGPSVFEWGRVVRVKGATSLQAVVAPVGTTWKVVGAFPVSAALASGR